MARSDKKTPLAGGEERTEDNFVPAWLAALVLVLLLAVMGLGGYLIRGLIAGQGRAQSSTALAVQKAKEAVNQEPSNLDAHVQLGYAYQLDKRYDQALDEYDYVVERDPRSTAALYNRGAVYLALQLDDEAEEAFWDVLEVQPDHELAAKSLGEMYAKRGQYRSLLKAVRPVVEVHPEAADLQYLTGLAYERTGHPDWAEARYRLALKYSPDLVEARKGLKRVESEQ